MNDDFLKRIPPHDSDAERSVIGAVLVKNEIFDAVAEIIETDDFYREHHRIIWAAIIVLAGAKSPIDLVTLTNALGGKDALERVGGHSDLAEMLYVMPSSTMAIHYAKIVREKSINRQLAAFGGEIAAQAYDSPGHWSPDATEELIATAEYGIAQIASKQIRKPEPAKTEMLSQALYNLEHGVINAIATGYPNLDRGFGGFDPGHLSILAARTSKGKTALATNFAINAAKAGIPTAYFTLEMTVGEMWLRALGREAQIDMFSARRRGYRDGERERAHAAEKLLDEAPLTILYRPSMRPRDLRLECRRLARETGLKFAVIDYFNLMRGNYRERERWREMAEVILALKEIAGELNIPLLVLSQINREGSEDAPPTIAQLRDTGSAEEHSSNVLLLWQKPPQKDSAPAYDEWEEIDVIIAKQRNGPAGLRVPMQFKKNWGRFECA